MSDIHEITWLRGKRKSFDQRKRNKVFARDGWRCVDCGCRLNLTVDHIIPLVLGGRNCLENLQTLCLPCNQKKGEAMPVNQVMRVSPADAQNRREYEYNGHLGLRVPFGTLLKSMGVLV